MSPSNESHSHRPRSSGPSSGNPSPALDNEAWLAQFSPVDEAELDERQRKFRDKLLNLYPDGRVGRRSDGGIFFYAIDPFTGRFTGPLPEVRS